MENLDLHVPPPGSNKALTSIPPLPIVSKAKTEDPGSHNTVQDVQVSTENHSPYQKLRRCQTE